MTPEQKRIKIAEACGWWGNRKENCMRPPNRTDTYCEIPNYFSDLNAMHEAEKVLTKEQRRKYVRTLFQTTNTDWDSHCATAAQRARAFLETLMLWEETK